MLPLLLSLVFSIEIIFTDELANDRYDCNQTDSFLCFNNTNDFDENKANYENISQITNYLNEIIEISIDFWNLSTESVGFESISFNYPLNINISNITRTNSNTWNLTNANILLEGAKSQNIIFTDIKFTNSSINPHETSSIGIVMENNSISYEKFMNFTRFTYNNSGMLNLAFESDKNIDVSQNSISYDVASLRIIHQSYLQCIIDGANTRKLIIDASTLEEELDTTMILADKSIFISFTDDKNISFNNLQFINMTLTIENNTSKLNIFQECFSELNNLDLQINTNCTISNSAKNELEIIGEPIYFNVLSNLVNYSVFSQYQKSNTYLPVGFALDLNGATAEIKFNLSNFELSGINITNSESKTSFTVVNDDQLFNNNASIQNNDCIFGYISEIKEINFVNFLINDSTISFTEPINTIKCINVVIENSTIIGPGILKSLNANIDINNFDQLKIHTNFTKIETPVTIDSYRSIVVDNTLTIVSDFNYSFGSGQTVTINADTVSDTSIIYITGKAELALSIPPNSNLNILSSQQNAEINVSIDTNENITLVIQPKVNLTFTKPLELYSTASSLANIVTQPVGNIYISNESVSSIYLNGNIISVQDFSYNYNVNSHLFLYAPLKADIKFGEQKIDNNLNMTIIVQNINPTYNVSGISLGAWHKADHIIFTDSGNCTILTPRADIFTATENVILIYQIKPVNRELIFTPTDCSNTDKVCAENQTELIEKLQQHIDENITIYCNTPFEPVTLSASFFNTGDLVINSTDFVNITISDGDLYSMVGAIKLINTIIQLDSSFSGLKLLELDSTSNVIGLKYNNNHITSLKIKASNFDQFKNIIVNTTELCEIMPNLSINTTFSKDESNINILTENATFYFVDNNMTFTTYDKTYVTFNEMQNTSTHLIFNVVNEATFDFKATNYESESIFIFINSQNVPSTIKATSSIPVSCKRMVIGNVDSLLNIRDLNCSSGSLTVMDPNNINLNQTSIEFDGYTFDFTEQPSTEVSARLSENATIVYGRAPINEVVKLNVFPADLLYVKGISKGGWTNQNTLIVNNTENCIIDAVLCEGIFIVDKPYIWQHTTSLSSLVSTTAINLVNSLEGTDDDLPNNTIIEITGSDTDLVGLHYFFASGMRLKGTTLNINCDWDNLYGSIELSSTIKANFYNSTAAATTIKINELKLADTASLNSSSEILFNSTSFDAVRFDQINNTIIDVYPIVDGITAPLLPIISIIQVEEPKINVLFDNNRVTYNGRLFGNQSMTLESSDDNSITNISVIKSLSKIFLKLSAKNQKLNFAGTGTANIGFETTNNINLYVEQPLNLDYSTGKKNITADLQTCFNINQSILNLNNGALYVNDEKRITDVVMDGWLFTINQTLEINQSSIKGDLYVVNSVIYNQSESCSSWSSMNIVFGLVPINPDVRLTVLAKNDTLSRVTGVSSSGWTTANTLTFKSLEGGNYAVSSSDFERFKFDNLMIEQEYCSSFSQNIYFSTDAKKCPDSSLGDCYKSNDEFQKVLVDNLNDDFVVNTSFIFLTAGFNITVPLVKIEHSGITIVSDFISNIVRFTSHKNMSFDNPISINRTTVEINAIVDQTLTIPDFELINEATISNINTTTKLSINATEFTAEDVKQFINIDSLYIYPKDKTSTPYILENSNIKLTEEGFDITFTDTTNYLQKIIYVYKTFPIIIKGPTNVNVEISSIVEATSTSTQVIQLNFETNSFISFTGTNFNLGRGIILKTGESNSTIDIKSTVNFSLFPNEPSHIMTKIGCMQYLNDLVYGNDTYFGTLTVTTDGTYVKSFIKIYPDSINVANMETPTDPSYLYIHYYKKSKANLFVNITNNENEIRFMQNISFIEMNNRVTIYPKNLSTTNVMGVNGGAWNTSETLNFMIPEDWMQLTIFCGNPRSFTVDKKFANSKIAFQNPVRDRNCYVFTDGSTLTAQCVKISSNLGAQILELDIAKGIDFPSDFTIYLDKNVDTTDVLLQYFVTNGVRFIGYNGVRTLTINANRVPPQLLGPIFLESIELTVSQNPADKKVQVDNINLNNSKLTSNGQFEITTQDFIADNLSMIDRLALNVNNSNSVPKFSPGDYSITYDDSTTTVTYSTNVLKYNKMTGSLSMSNNGQTKITITNDNLAHNNFEYFFIVPNASEIIFNGNYSEDRTRFVIEANNAGAPCSLNAIAVSEGSLNITYGKYILTDLTTLDIISESYPSNLANGKLIIKDSTLGSILIDGQLVNMTSFVFYSNISCELEIIMSKTPFNIEFGYNKISESNKVLVNAALVGAINIDGVQRGGWWTNQTLNIIKTATGDVTAKCIDQRTFLSTGIAFVDLTFTDYPLGGPITSANLNNIVNGIISYPHDLKKGFEITFAESLANISFPITRFIGSGLVVTHENSDTFSSMKLTFDGTLPIFGNFLISDTNLTLEPSSPNFDLEFDNIRLINNTNLISTNNLFIQATLLEVDSSLDQVDQKIVVLSTQCPLVIPDYGARNNLLVQNNSLTFSPNQIIFWTAEKTISINGQDLLTVSSNNVAQSNFPTLELNFFNDTELKFVGPFHSDPSNPITEKIKLVSDNLITLSATNIIPLNLTLNNLNIMTDFKTMKAMPANFEMKGSLTINDPLVIGIQLIQDKVKLMKSLTTIFEENYYDIDITKYSADISVYSYFTNKTSPSYFNIDIQYCSNFPSLYVMPQVNDTNYVVKTICTNKSIVTLRGSEAYAVYLSPTNETVTVESPLISIKHEIEIVEFQEVMCIYDQVVDPFDDEVCSPSLNNTMTYSKFDESLKIPQTILREKTTLYLSLDYNTLVLSMMKINGIKLSLIGVNKSCTVNFNSNMESIVTYLSLTNISLSLTASSQPTSIIFPYLFYVNSTISKANGATQLVTLTINNISSVSSFSDFNVENLIINHYIVIPAISSASLNMLFNDTATTITKTDSNPKLISFGFNSTAFNLSAATSLTLEAKCYTNIYNASFILNNNINITASGNFPQYPIFLIETNENITLASTVSFPMNIKASEIIYLSMTTPTLKINPSFERTENMVVLNVIDTQIRKVNLLSGSYGLTTRDETTITIPNAQKFNDLAIRTDITVDTVDLVDNLKHFMIETDVIANGINTPLTVIPTVNSVQIKLMPENIWLSNTQNTQIKFRKDTTAGGIYSIYMTNTNVTTIFTYDHDQIQILLFELKELTSPICINYNETSCGTNNVTIDQFNRYFRNMATTKMHYVIYVNQDGQLTIPVITVLQGLEIISMTSRQTSLLLFEESEKPTETIVGDFNFTNVAATIDAPISYSLTMNNLLLSSSSIGGSARSKVSITVNSLPDFSFSKISRLSGLVFKNTQNILVVPDFNILPSIESLTSPNGITFSTLTVSNVNTFNLSVNSVVTVPISGVRGPQINLNYVAQSSAITIRSSDIYNTLKIYHQNPNSFMLTIKAVSPVSGSFDLSTVLVGKMYVKTDFQSLRVFGCNNLSKFSSFTISDPKIYLLDMYFDHITLTSSSVLLADNTFDIDYTTLPANSNYKLTIENFHNDPNYITVNNHIGATQFNIPIIISGVNPTTVVALTNTWSSYTGGGYPLIVTVSDMRYSVKIKSDVEGVLGMIATESLSDLVLETNITPTRKPLSGGAVAGIVIACAIVVFAIIFVVLMMMKNRRGPVDNLETFVYDI